MYLLYVHTQCSRSNSQTSGVWECDQVVVWTLDPSDQPRKGLGEKLERKYLEHQNTAVGVATSLMAERIMPRCLANILCKVFPQTLHLPSGVQTDKLEDMLDILLSCVVVLVVVRLILTVEVTSLESTQLVCTVHPGIQHAVATCLLT